MAQAHGSHDNPPQDHDGGDEDAGLESFQQDVGEGLEKGVRDEEDGERGVVIPSGHVQACLEPVELCIANVCSVEETAEVQEAQPGDEFQI